MKSNAIQLTIDITEQRPGKRQRSIDTNWEDRINADNITNPITAVIPPLLKGKGGCRRVLHAGCNDFSYGFTDCDQIVQNVR